MSGRPLPLKQSAFSASIETTVLAQYLDSEGDSGGFFVPLEECQPEKFLACTIGSALKAEVTHNMVVGTSAVRSSYI